MPRCRKPLATASSDTGIRLFFVLGGFVVVIAAVWYFTGPVSKVAGVLKVVAEAAEGDLTKEVEIERDKDTQEVGRHHQGNA